MVAKTKEEYLVEDNIKLVHFTINKYHKNLINNLNNLDSGLSYDDIYQMGCEGLFKATQRFKPELGFKFSTFAVRQITYEIKRRVRDAGTIVKHSRLARELAKEMAVDDEISIKSIMEKTGCSIKVADQVQFYIKNKNTRSIDEIIYNDEGADIDLGSTIEAANDFDIDFKIMYNDFLNTLSSRRRKIAELLASGLSQTEISKIVKVSQPHVSREIKFIRNAIKNYQGGELCVL